VCIGVKCYAETLIPILNQLNPSLSPPLLYPLQVATGFHATAATDTNGCIRDLGFRLTSWLHHWIQVQQWRAEVLGAVNTYVDL
jgi:hypothetical protein